MVEQPTYEVIKREDMIAAFRSAMQLAITQILARIDQLIDIYSSVQASSLWTWDYTSRWDYDTFA